MALQENPTAVTRQNQRAAEQIMMKEMSGEEGTLGNQVGSISTSSTQNSVVRCVRGFVHLC